MEEQENRISIEFISVFGLPPVQFVDLAADLKCRHISIALEPMLSNPHDYPAWSLRKNPTLRREMVAAMQDRNVAISIGEGFLVRPGTDLRDCAADLDVMCELGVRRINTTSIDPDLSRTFDQFATLVEMADAVGMETTVEFAPRLAIGDLPTALAALHHVQQPNFRLLIDTMHLVRSGSGAEDIAALDRDMIGYVQISDVPLVSQFTEYMDEARYERLAPGTGELPLLDILSVLPRHLVLGLEIPMLEHAKAGIGPHERLGRCIDATRDLLAQLEK